MQVPEASPLMYLLASITQSWKKWLRRNIWLFCPTHFSEELKKMFKTLKLELVPEVSVLPQHLQRPARVEIVAAKEETSNEAKEEPEDEVLVEDDDENGEKSETESFGFEVPDEAIIDAGDVADVVAVDAEKDVEAGETRDDVSTPVQDENEEDFVEEVVLSFLCYLYQTNKLGKSLRLIVQMNKIMPIFLLFV